APGTRRPAARPARGQRRPLRQNPGGGRCCGSDSACCGSSTGILQAQPKMAIGLPGQVIEPVAATSPRWVQDLANWAGTSWSYHPIQAGASAVWIQIGIGIWLVVAAKGPWSQLAGLASVGWGLAV